MVSDYTSSMTALVTGFVLKQLGIQIPHFINETDSNYGSGSHLFLCIML